MADWAKIRAQKIAADLPPADWPAGVQAISLQGLASFGINEATGQLCWDGRQNPAEQQPCRTAVQGSRRQ
jgi:hypothetical protein